MKCIGHNPPAPILMVVITTIGGFAMVVTGFVRYAGQTGSGSWRDSIRVDDVFLDQEIAVAAIRTPPNGRASSV